MTAAVVTQPQNGVLTFNADGSFTYTPSANFSGTDTFTYRASDSVNQSTPATVTITVNAVNDIPAAANDTFTTPFNTALTPAAPGVLTNDTDADTGATLTPSVVTQPQHGAVTMNANGSFTYTPTSGYSGPDSFTYKVNDGTVDSAPATVNITVQAEGRGRRRSDRRGPDVVARWRRLRRRRRMDRRGGRGPFAAGLAGHVIAWTPTRSVSEGVRRLRFGLV